MLPAGCRMRRHTEFAATIRAGRRARRGVLVAHLHVESASTVVSTADMRPTRTCGEPSCSPVRVGFVVPKAVGTAVDRNLARRRLRHLLRERLSAFPAGTALVLRVLPGAAECSAAQLRSDLDSVLVAVTSTGVSPRQRTGDRRPTSRRAGHPARGTGREAGTDTEQGASST
ncbi:MAG: ribonuclease P protein component [Dactylosporangium sp.]|nr:ribonuclease P protein component [Dactylosporangium sp.]NNJ61061.1 ribonuclease P protein component [Dactylosporangium sp.]